MAALSNSAHPSVPKSDPPRPTMIFCPTWQGGFPSTLTAVAITTSSPSAVIRSPVEGDDGLRGLRRDVPEAESRASSGDDERGGDVTQVAEGRLDPGSVIRNDLVLRHLESRLLQQRADRSS